MYTYNTLLDDVNYLSRNGFTTGVVGASECGRVIPYIHCGSISSGPQIIITAGIHAREHLSSLLVMRQVFFFLKLYGKTSGGIYFVPMLNPDGNLLCTEGINTAPSYKRKFLQDVNGGSSDFSLWKANINAVDLNTNFDARFSCGKENVFTPAPQSYVGRAACDQSETRAIVEFSLKVAPTATISYHAKGQELYWEFFQRRPERERDERFAEFVNGFLGYKKVDGDLGSAGGYKDWCISKLKIPSLTIEIIPDCYCHPLLDESLIDNDFELNKDLPKKMLEYFSK